MQYPDFSENAKFILRTDASKIALGAVLSNSNDLPVAYSSRPISKEEKNYSIVELELLAIVWAVQHFRLYMYGKYFDILTDHRPLVHLLSMLDPASRLLKFRLQLENYDFKIIHVKGKDNATADALSRIVITSDELKELTRKVQVNAITRAQSRVTELNEVEVLKKPLGVVELLPIWGNCSDQFVRGVNFQEDKGVIEFEVDEIEECAREETLVEINRVLENNQIKSVAYFKDKSLMLDKVLASLKSITITEVQVIIITKPVRIKEKGTQQLIMNEHHMAPSSGHYGSNKMFETIKRKYYWPYLRKDIEEFVKSCTNCAMNKHYRSIKEPLAYTTSATEPMISIELDLAGPLPIDSKGNRYILTIHCKFSRYIIAVPIPDKTALTVAQAFVKHFVLIYNCPKIILTDRGKDLMAEVCKILEISQLRSSAYHHQTLGITESSHRHLGEFLRI